jgi:hypothetical protein
VGDGLTVNCAVLVVLPKAPEIVIVVGIATELVTTLKVALVAPGDTVTDVGTVTTEVLLLDIKTAAPPEEAAPVRVTVT